MGDPDVATGLVEVLYCIAFFTSFLSAIASLGGTLRKHRLLHRVLNWPVSSAADAHPSRVTVSLEVFVTCFMYTFTDWSVVTQEVISTQKNNTKKSWYLNP